MSAAPTNDELDFVAAARNNRSVADYSKEALVKSELFDCSRIALFRVHGFSSKCTQSNLVLELSGKEECKDFLSHLLNPKAPKLPKDGQAKYDLIVAYYDSMESIVALHFIRRSYDQIFAFAELYDSDSGKFVITGGHSANELSDWLKDRGVRLIK